MGVGYPQSNISYHFIPVLLAQGCSLPFLVEFMVFIPCYPHPQEVGRACLAEVLAPSGVKPLITKSGNPYPAKGWTELAQRQQPRSVFRG